MALFKQLRGNRASLNTQPLVDGYAYFCVDDGTFHIDFKDENGVLRRKQINAKDAESLCGMSLDEIKAYTDNAIVSHNNSTTAHSDLRTAIDGKANKSEGAFFVEGSGTTDSTAKTSTWTGTSDRITEYYDGLTIRYKIGVVGQTTTTLNINGLGAKPIYLYNTTKLTTQFPVNSIINLIYHADLNSGCWMCSDYDSNTNTQQRVYATTTNTEYPITTRYNTTTGSTYYAEYGRYSTGVTLNPSTNTITASKFKGALTGNADTATKATQDASGNVITSTYETKSDATSKLNNINSQISQLSSEKVDKSEVGLYITPEMYGANGDGTTDDSEYIQMAIDAAGSNGTVYLSNKTYVINTGLVVSSKSAQFVCDGVIKYTGNGSAVTIATPEGAYLTRVSVYVNRIEAPNGTAIKLDATGGSMDMAKVEVNTIYQSQIGLHLYGGQGQEGGFIMYSTFRIGELQAYNIGILAEAGDVGDQNFVNENIYYLGRICGGCETGIKLVKSCSNKFLQGSFEGIADNGTSIYLQNSSDNYIKNFRWAENYGSTRIKFVGYCKDNDFEGSTMCLEEVDISELGDIGGFYNILRSPYISAGKGGHRAGYIALVNKAWGITYVPDYHDNNYLHLKSDTYADKVIERIDCTIYTAFRCDTEDVDGMTFTLGSFYSGCTSLARGYPITFHFGTDHGKIKIKDNRGDLILDNSTGKYAGKTASIKWDGYNYRVGKDVWAINIQGELYATEKFVDERISSVNISLDELEQDLKFKSNHYGLVVGSNGGNNYRVVVLDNGIVTTAPVSEVNQLSMAIDTDGSVYNGCGYVYDTRLNSSGTITTEQTGAMATGYIRAVGGEMVKMSGWDITSTEKLGNSANCIAVYNANFEFLGMFTAKDSYTGIFETTCQNYRIGSVVKSGDVYSWIVPSGVGIAYIRVGAFNLESHNPSSFANGIKIVISGGAEITPVVESVNGKTGAVQLTAADVGALPITAEIPSLSGYATETYVQNFAQPKGNYLTTHQDISGKADKSSAETWTFTLENGTTVTKKVVLA